MAYPYPRPYPTSGSSSITPAIIRPSFFSVARHIYVRDGFAGYFRGLGPCFLRTFPVNASALFVYEETMRILGAEKVHFHSLVVWMVRILTVPLKTRS